MKLSSKELVTMYSHILEVLSSSVTRGYRSRVSVIMTDKNHRRDFQLKVSLKAKLFAEDNRVSQKTWDNLPKAMGCRVLVTMGAGVKHFEDDIGSDGTLKMDHTFTAIQHSNTDFTNQIQWNHSETETKWTPHNEFLRKHGIRFHEEYDYLLKSHVIFWVFCIHTEDDDPVGVMENTGFEGCWKKGDQPRRAYLVGSTVAAIKGVLEKLSKNETINLKCQHNFNETMCELTLSSWGDDNVNQEQLKNWEKLAPHIKVSSLQTMDAVEDMVNLQQKCMAEICLEEIRNNRMGLADTSAPEFLSMCTFLQLKVLTEPDGMFLNISL